MGRTFTPSCWVTLPLGYPQCPEFLQAVFSGKPRFGIAAQRRSWCPGFDQTWQPVAFSQSPGHPCRRGSAEGTHLLRCGKGMEGGDSWMGL